MSDELDTQISNKLAVFREVIDARPKITTSVSGELKAGASARITSAQMELNFALAERAHRDDALLKESLGRLEISIEKLYRSSRPIEVLTIVIIFFSVINVFAIFMESSFANTLIGYIYISISLVVSAFLVAFIVSKNRPAPDTRTTPEWLRGFRQLATRERRVTL